MKQKEVGFYITRGTGFHIMFENGYVVSVQFSPDSYCANSRKEIPKYDRNSIVYCPNAEVAVWNEATVGERGYPELIEMPNFGGDTVGAYFTPKEVLGLLCWAASQQKTENSQNNSNSSPTDNMSKAEATKLRIKQEYEARKADMATKFSDEEILEAIYQNATSMATVMMQYNRMIDDRWEQHSEKE